MSVSTSRKTSNLFFELDSFVTTEPPVVRGPVFQEPYVELAGPISASLRVPPEGSLPTGKPDREPFVEVAGPISASLRVRPEGSLPTDKLDREPGSELAGPISASLRVPPEGSLPTGKPDREPDVFTTSPEITPTPVRSPTSEPSQNQESGQVLVMRSTLAVNALNASNALNALNALNASNADSPDGISPVTPQDLSRVRTEPNALDAANEAEDRRIGSTPLPPNISVEAAAALDQKLREIEQALKEEAQLLATKATRHRALVDDSRDDALIGLEPAPLPASWHIDGDPSPRIKIMTCSPEGGLLSGIWTCRAATFRFDYANFDETVHIIRGVAEVRIGDEITHLRPGSIAYFPKGASSEWTVHEPIHKYFVQRNSNRGVRKIQGFMRHFRRSEPGGLG
jgi:uncharacterized cupin superfamily protein